MCAGLIGPEVQSPSGTPHLLSFFKSCIKSDVSFQKRHGNLSFLFVRDGDDDDDDYACITAVR